MRWDDHLSVVFEDLEQQAEALALAERDAQVAELRRAEFATVDLEGRLHATLGHPVVLGVPGVGSVTGVLSRMGAGWCLVDAGGAEWLVRLAALASLRGIRERAVPEQARPITSRLGLGSALRGVAEAGAEAVVHRADGSSTRGVVVRVAADALDLRADHEGYCQDETVPFAAITALRSA